MEEELCLVDSCTTNTVLTEVKYFQTLKRKEGNVLTIAGRDAVIVGSGRATIILPMGTQLTIEDALLYPDATRTLLSYRDVRMNGIHVETFEDNKEEFLLFTKDDGYGKKTLEKMPSLSSGLYYTYIKPVPHVAYKVIFQNVDAFQTWHDRLGHPGIGMMRKIICNSIGHNLSNTKFPQSSDVMCTSCATGKLILRPSYLKIKTEPLKFLERIQGDICGPIQPSSGPFRYFMVLIDASSRWSHVSLLSTRNHAFAKLIAQVIKLKAHHSEHRIKTIRMDNAAEFSSKAFNDYCMALGIEVQHSVPYVHTQNGLAEALIKRIKLIARPMLQGCNLPTSCWGHAVLHAADLIQLRPTAYHSASPLQLVRGDPPSISHLRKFGCAVYVPISPPKRTSMGPHRKLGIYVGFQSPSIIKFLEPLTGDLLTARHADCIFNEDHFPALGGDYKYHTECQEINWDAQHISKEDPRTKESELQVQRILNLQNIADNLPDAFTAGKGVTKSYIPARNVPERVEVPNKTTHLPSSSKNGRSTAIPIGTASRKRNRKQRDTPSDPVNATQPIVERHQVDESLPHPASIVHSISDAGTSERPDEIVLGNTEPSIGVQEISINYLTSGATYDRKTTDVDIYFSTSIAENLQNEPDPKSMVECKKRSDWNKWKEAIEAELASLTKREVFSSVIPTPPEIFPVGFKWVFVRKRNENNEVVRYKARLVAQGFTQRPGIDFNETYSPVMSGITFRYLISLAVQKRLSMQLMDVVTAYLYGSLDSDIYMKVPDGISIPNPGANRNMYCVKLKRSLYGLKQSGRMWYNRLSEYLLQKGYSNNDDCPCVFIKKSSTGFCIISVYVDDLNIVGNTQDVDEARNHLKTEFEMKDLGQTKFCLGLHIEHLHSGILVHQSAYIQKILEKFNMDKSYPIKTPMVVRSLDVEKDVFRPRDKGEEVLGSEYPYLSLIGALMYLANCTRPDIAFAVNLLARHSAAPTKRHWTGGKQILRYLNGTKDLGLFYQKNQDPNLIGYADAGYLSDPHNARSQTGFVFLHGGTAISWKSSKQTLVATSTNHAEIIALYEASRECVWLRRMIKHIVQSCGIGSMESPTIMYEDNAACVTQMQTGYIKSNLNKHIAPKYFFPHELQKSGEIQILLAKSCDNLADLFTKSLPASTFEKCVRGIGMRRLRDLQESGGASF
jgi:hypothetical protein